MGYIDPFQSDAETIKNHGVLSRKQADMDYAEIKAKGGFDAALLTGNKFRVPEGYKRIPGASRSGALDPSTRARFERMEREGEVELARDEYGKLLGYRPLD
ncbi:hypothetical protein [Nocardioides sp. SYSU DS0651]|uniref:hypothetical protein n=1 Tax=Nocardioides sp. SYSU DS0651 TaxID=3415955 RepID=UPI003F4BAC93